MFFVFAEWVSLLAVKVRELPWKRLAPAAGLTALLMCPALYYMAFHRGQQLAFIKRPHLYDLVQLLYFLAADGGKYRKALTVIYVIGSLIAMRVLFSRRRTEGQSTERLGLAVALACTVLPIAITFVISFWVPIFFPRDLLICLPPLVLLAARGLVELRPVWLRAAAFVRLLGVTAECLMWYYPHPKDDWRSLTGYLLRHSEPGDIIIGCPPGAGWPVQYYVGAMNSYRPRYSYSTATALLQEIHQGSPHPARFWLVSWGDNPDEEAIRKRVAGNYARMDEQHYYGFLTLALYSAVEPNR